MPPLPPPPGLDYESTLPLEPKRFRPTAWVAWAVILGVCVLLPALRAMSEKAKATAAVPTTMSAEALPPPPALDVRLELAAKVWVGSVRMLQADNQSLEEAVGMPSKTPTEKITTAIVLAEFGRLDETRKLLRDADTPDARVFLKHYSPPPDVPSTTPASAPAAALPAVAGGPLPAEIRAHYGWFADLAESYGRPADDPLRTKTINNAKRAAALVGVLFSVLVVGGAVGLVLFVLAIVLFALGQMTFAVTKPRGPAHVYVEAMAVYLGGFVAVSVAMGLLLKNAPLEVEIAGLLGVVVLASVWPLLRGVPWAVQKLDWGIHTGRGVVREAFAGVVGYFAGMPIIALGLMITVALMSLAQTDASHPITQEIGGGAGTGSWAVAIRLLLIASVFAPLTEELLFRGGFVSHLRGGVGAVLAAVISGVIFAAVHPQGWAAIPVLGSVGAVLALIRQWRGSLVASIAAHAMNNTAIVGLLIFVTR